jgi:single-strand DNA-binding protein
MSLVNISIVGNLARAPEQKYFSTGKVKTTLVVAVNGGKKSQQDEGAAEFYRVETWGKLAEATGKYLSKGNQVTVTGRLVLDYWTDRSGKERVTPIVEASQLAFPPKLRVVGADEPGLVEGEDAINPISGEVVMSDDDDDDDSDSDDDDESDRSDNGRDAQIRTAPERKGKARRTA